VIDMTKMNSAQPRHSSNPESGLPGTQPMTVGKAIGRIFGFGIPATAVMTAALAVVFAVALDGCSSKSQKTSESKVSQNSQPQNTNVTMAPSSTPSPSPAVPAKKKISKPSTVIYSDKTSGISFRYPRKYALLMPEKGKQSVEDLAKLPINFVDQGGTSIAAVELKNGPATSFLKVSVIKGVSQEQCGKFAMASPENSDTPIQPDDEAGVSKVSVRGLEFAKAEEVTEQLEARYYHHFELGDNNETGACYEFALGISEPPENTKPVDDVAMFEQLERIFGTVKIKPEQVPAVTAGIPEHPVSGTNPQ
jgi:hypothetical protein